MESFRILVILFTFGVAAIADAADFSITENGAVADGEKVQTAAIQKTIEAAATAGGGTVLIPRGTFRSGAIFLKPGVHLQLDEGAVLKGSDDIADYPIQDTRIEGRINQWAVALVNATGTDGLRISGAGTIDGSGLKFWEAFWQRRKENPKCTPRSRPPAPHAHPRCEGRKSERHPDARLRLLDAASFPMRRRARGENPHRQPTRTRPCAEHRRH